MYRTHAGLLRTCGSKLIKKFPYINREDIFSAINISFLRCVRAWDPSKGKLSTLLWIFAQGECLHFVRDHGYMVKAPCGMRLMGSKARKLLISGTPPADVCDTLQCTMAELKEALESMQGVYHEQMDWEMHNSRYITPDQYIEIQELWDRADAEGIDVAAIEAQQEMEELKAKAKAPRINIASIRRSWRRSVSTEPMQVQRRDED